MSFLSFSLSIPFVSRDTCGRLGSFVCALGLLFWFFVSFHVFRIEMHPSRLDQLYNIRQCRGYLATLLRLVTDP